MREQTIKLKHDEVAAKVNQSTGEIIELQQNMRSNNIPSDKEIHAPDGIFRKNYSASWLFLDKCLTDLEMRVVTRLCFMAKMNTNSLEPLNNEMAMTEVAEILGVHRHKAKKLVEKLFDLGVYAKFEVAKEDVPYTKYWVLNPYLSFSGRLIASDITRLFIGTKIEKAYSSALKYRSVKE